MVRGILADHNIDGQVKIIVRILESEDWKDFWSSLNLPVRTFRDLGLTPEATDEVLWHSCQHQQFVLITANRNADGPDSLEETLRRQNVSASLPVMTLADPDRILQSRAYAERVAVQLLDYLLNIDHLRGSGRLYLP